MINESEPVPEQNRIARDNSKVMENNTVVQQHCSKN